MPVYEYTALNSKGKNVSGIIDSESGSAARQKLRLSKIFPISVNELHETSAKKDVKSSMPRLFASRIKPSEISIMTRQLSTLVSAAFPLVSAVDTLVPQTKSSKLKKTLAHIKDSIVEGNSFADSLSQYPEIFSSLYLNMVRAGETSGTLEIVLERLADIMEKQQTLNNKIKSAMAYPVLMSIIGTLVLFFLLTFIVPSITSIFTDMNQTLPGPTLFLIGASNFFKSFWWVIIAFAIILTLTIQQIKKTKKGRWFWDKTILLIPVIGTLIKKLSVARFARTFGSLLENGVSILTALDIVKNIAGNILISNSIEKAAVEVEKGQDLGLALATDNVFPSLSTQMIQVGEKSGKLEIMLAKIADVFEKEVETNIMSMTSLLEPIMILIMGVIIGFIVLSICLPIFEMNQLIM